MIKKAGVAHPEPWVCLHEQVTPLDCSIDIMIKREKNPFELARSGLLVMEGTVPSMEKAKV